MNLRFLVTLLLGATASAAFAAPAKITVQVDRPGHPVSATLWGIFFEDINLSADGGIYPELVRNRSFEDSEQPESWKLINAPEGRTEMATDTSKPLNPLNRRGLRLKLSGDAHLINEGYWGMNIVQGDCYTLKLAARAADGFSGPIGVKVLAAGKELAGGEITGITGDWKYHTLEFTAASGDSKAKLQIYLRGQGTLYLDMVSLTPNKTWKDHGLRPDLADAIAALHPAFLRFPGGCWVEGDTMDKMYDWKKTIGAVDLRMPLYNIWQYYATHGLGYHEYLQLCEDLGATPLFDINCGMSHKENVPMDLMAQWVQDALDAIEYANGATNTVWGGLRARNGHPAPFHLKYMEIGNENGGAAYRERWPLFVNAIKARYPEVHLIANHWQGSYPKDPMPEIVDEHYYNVPEFFLQQAHRYDSYDRNGPKVFVGEYAVTRSTGRGNLRGAIGEAAFMTGMERNSDVVVMAAYAPLFCNANHQRWPINLINFDSSRWFGIPSYYVQKLFSEYCGDVVLPTAVEAEPELAPLSAGCIGIGTWNTSAEFKDIRVTAPDGKVLLASDFSQNANGWKKLGGGTWSVKDGAMQQTAQKEFIRALAGDMAWTDYTLELKARKLAGHEGFLILFHIGDDEDRVWWNLGGWENTKHGLELEETLDQKSGRIETGRWYAIKVEVQGMSIKCSLDGQLIHDVKQIRRTTPGLFASATRDTQRGEIIVKVVNAAAVAAVTEINLKGAGKLSGSAQAIVLTSDSAKAENSLDEPTNVAPITQTLDLPGPTFQHAFPANSLTVLRVKAEK
ncbi:MAG: alpha-L-arabinofuranosidase C-terminal domain-containing protein [Verrucomicrobiota bacterium]